MSEPTNPDLKALRDLMMWARDKGFRVGPEIHIGTLHVQIADLRQDKGMIATEPTVEQMYGVPDEAPPDGTMG